MKRSVSSRISTSAKTSPNGHGLLLLTGQSEHEARLWDKKQV